MNFLGGLLIACMVWKSIKKVTRKERLKAQPITADLTN